LKIAVVGAHGTGKTVLAKTISKQQGLPLITEQARIVAKEININNCQELLANPELARAFQWKVLERQIKAQLKHNEFVSDRSTLDCIAYWKLYLGDKGKETSQYIFKARLHAWKQLELIIYVPPVMPAKNDGFRLVDKQREVDAYIQEELNLIQKKVPVISADENYTPEQFSKKAIHLQG